MRRRWPAFYQPVLDWLGDVEAAIYRQNHPEQGAFIAITNAIEFQFEIGADEPTVRHLLEALSTFAQRTGLDPNTLGLSSSPDDVVAKLRPETR